MRIKRLLLSIILPLLLLVVLPQATIAATTANTFQITNDGSQQKDPIIYKDIVAYDSLSDIWAYNFDTQQNYPLLQKSGQQNLTDFKKHLIVYEDVDSGDSTTDVRLFNAKTGKDILIAGGAGSQGAGVTNGDEVIYIDGGACGSIHAYNLKKNTDVVISPTGCTPLRIYDNTVVWPYGAPGGTNIYGYNLVHHSTFDVVNESGFQESPNIFEDKVIYLDYVTGNLGDYNAIKVKDLKSHLEETVYQSTTATLQWPSISDKYVVWSESTAQHVNGIKAANLKTGEVLEVQAQGPHQNSHTMPTIWKNIATWMSFRSGNGDIYGSVFSNTP
jgi:hypothetical protein